MARASSHFVCQECGTTHPRWSGRCDGCGVWNQLVEEAQPSKSLSKALSRKVMAEDFFQTLSGEAPESESQPNRLLSKIEEFDRVCGGGMVPGSVILVGGDPGVGKSTLLLQLVAALSKKSECAYISGEEALGQVRLRAERLQVNKSSVHIASATNVTEIVAALDKLSKVKPSNLALVVIDSIQTMAVDALDSAAGTVSQVRASAQEFISYAKKTGCVTILVGHVTKEGVLAGPRVLEHMVDTVLYFEGDRNYDYRILRSTKNRFGATDEIGVFSMADKGLLEVKNPSALFLANHQQEVSGTAIFAGMEGTRPILLEVQALVSQSYLPSPRRTSVGWDNNRLAMILAVLESRCGISSANRDIYLNVAGGLKITEPAADLAVAVALISALKNKPVPLGSVFFGEIGLAGEVRGVNHTESRLKEAKKLGFTQAYFAASKSKNQSSSDALVTQTDIGIHQLKYLRSFSKEI